MDHRELWPYGLRVLVIDDDCSYLSVMEDLLLKCSYKVTTYKASHNG
uniref:B-type response regulator n=1 Tax=Oryza sativa subsp. japonica TaxID=39947 RepID=C5NSJ3_ORYSJ|nr:B-type response regulator [Oryza sativa Japonica Group]